MDIKLEYEAYYNNKYVGTRYAWFISIQSTLDHLIKWSQSTQWKFVPLGYVKGTKPHSIEYNTAIDKK